MVIQGGRELRGDVRISGYKHALTVLVAAAVALGIRVRLSNVPDTTESRVLKGIVDQLGATGRLEAGVWLLDTTTMRSRPVPARLSGLVHGSLYLVPALLARFGEVSFTGAGGDRIGSVAEGGGRPTEQVVEVLERFGATVETAGGLHARADRLRGCSIDLMDFSTDHERLRGPRASSATKTALILAAVSDGKTMLRNPVDRDATRELCDFLRACGVTVTRQGDIWCVEAGASTGEVAYHIISDSTGIVTYAACVAHVGGWLRITGITGERTRAAIDDELRVMAEMGVPYSWGPDADSLCVGGAREISPVHIDIDCNGFSTDAHPLLAVPLLRARGVSRISDHVWTNRFAYAGLLAQMGARTEVKGNTLELHPSDLRAPAEPLRPTDSRAAAAAVLAALGTHGTTVIQDAGHLERSYEALVERLCAVGASVWVEPSADSA